MRRTLLVGVVAAWTTLFALPSANAKDFRPGDVRVCTAAGCAAVVDRSVLPALSSFYYTGARPVRVRQPALGTPYYELRFRNGYVTGIVATGRLDRFLTYGVHDQRFACRTWYTLPRQVSVELRRLTAVLRPLRLTRAALVRSRCPR